MKTSYFLLPLVLCTACNATVEIKTDENYEAAVLPDGSEVYVNRNSTISYKKSFDPRTLYLDGEAFFTVKSGESPFTVATEHGTVKVLGTEFNVKTTSDQIAVDVKKGLVKLETEYADSKIKKGGKALYRDGEQAIQKMRSKQEYRKWIRSLEKEFKKLGKELKPVLKEIGNDLKKVGKKIGDEFKD